jgi:hypothetical protein
VHPYLKKSINAPTLYRSIGSPIPNRRNNIPIQKRSTDVFLGYYHSSAHGSWSTNFLEPKWSTTVFCVFLHLGAHWYRSIGAPRLMWIINVS